MSSTIEEALLNEERQDAATVAGMPHNQIRFEIDCPYIFAVVGDGDVDLSRLVERLRESITATMRDEAEAYVCCHSSHVVATGGNGTRDCGKPIHFERLTFDFS